ncbi:MAG: peptidoglycan DD-metalloendopeptidase family protein [Smithella sp.]
MSDNLFTLMIIPNRKSGVKKITIPKVFVRNVLIVAIIAVVASLYVIYDYASIKRDRAELARLKDQVKEQSQQFEDLALKIDSFSDRMEELRQVDKKIRTLAYETSQDKKLPLGVGGSDKETRIKDLMGQEQKTIVAEMGKNISKLNEDANMREKSFQELLAFLNEQKSVLASTPSLWPVEGWVTSEFGSRKSPFGAGTEFHKGLDISTRFGKEIIAPADGLVVKSGFEQRDGNYVRMEHGHGFETAYLHLSRIVAKQGMRVKRGEIIGYVGDTGRSTGPHLHYAVSVNGVAVDPERFVR